MSEMSLHQIEQKLAYLGKQAIPVARRAVLAGAKIVAAKQQAATYSAIRGGVRGVINSKGNMRRSIKARSMKTTGSQVGAKSGFDVGRRKKDADPNTGALGHHGHLFIGGTVKRKTGSVRIRIGRKTIGRKSTLKPGQKAQNRGKMTPEQPSFIATAAAAVKGDVAIAIRNTLVEGLNAAIDKIGG